MLLALLALACRPPVPEIADTAGDTGVLDTADSGGPDTGLDSGQDTGTDTGGDSGADTGPDTSVDSGADTGTDTAVAPPPIAWFTFSEVAFVSDTREISDIFPTGSLTFASITHNFDAVNPVFDELFRVSDTFVVEQISGAEVSVLASTTREGLMGDVGFAPAATTGVDREGDGPGRGASCALRARAEDVEAEGILRNTDPVRFNYGIFSIDRPGSADATIALTNLLSLPQASSNALFFGKLREVGGAHSQRGALRIDLDAERWRATLREFNAHPDLDRTHQDFAAQALANAVAATPDVDTNGDYVNDAFSALIVFEMAPCNVTTR